MKLRAATKELLYGAAHVAGFSRFARSRLAETLTVLTYHSFDDGDAHPYLFRMPVSRLEEQVTYLRSAFEIVDLEDGVNRMTGTQTDSQGGSTGRPMLAITVDDGYGDNHTALVSLARRSQLPVTVFLATDYLDTGRLPWPTRISSVLHFASVDELDAPYSLPLRTEAERIRAGQVLRQKLSCLDHGDRDHAIAEIEQMVRPEGLQTLKPLTWDQVRDMRDAGIRFGAHTRYHGWLDRVSATDLEEELGPSKARIEAETDMVCRSLAYPNGNWNASIVAAAKTAGFSHAVTQDGGRNVSQSMDPFAVRRIEVPYNERIGTFACRLTGVAF